MDAFEIFCSQLSHAIKSSPYSRAELADKLGVKPATIKSWCVGRRSPTVFRLLKLSEILEVDAHALFLTPHDPQERTECLACGRTFRRKVGYRIHLALRARADDVHLQLLREQESEVAPMARASA